MAKKTHSRMELEERRRIHNRTTNPTGLPKYQQRSRAGLACALRDARSDEWVGMVLVALIEGEDPFVTRNADGTPKAGAVVDGASAPPWVTRQWAMKTFLERRDGKPSESIYIEQELRAALGVQVNVSSTSLAAADPAKKAQIRSLLRDVLETRGRRRGSSGYRSGKVGRTRRRHRRRTRRRDRVMPDLLISSLEMAVRYRCVPRRDHTIRFLRRSGDTGIPEQRVPSVAACREDDGSAVSLERRAPAVDVYGCVRGCPQQMQLPCTDACAALDVLDRRAESRIHRRSLARHESSAKPDDVVACRCRA